MSIETNIPQIDNEGDAVNVITEYKVHTLSLVGVNALGRNFTKLKGLHPQNKNEEVSLEIEKKIDKAKALDAKEGEQSVTQEQPVVEQTDTPVVEQEAAPAVAEVTAPVTSDVTSDEGSVTAEEAALESTDEQAAVVTEQDQVAEPVPVEDKAKMFTVDELGAVQQIIFNGVSDLMRKAFEAAPDAGYWEVSELVSQSVNAVDNALWWEEQKVWDAIWDEVHSQVVAQVSKAKSLKVSEAMSTSEALKSFAAINPEMALLIQTEIETSRSKSLDSEKETKKVLRAKALESGAVTFKRMATEDNTVENIVDALSMIELAAPDAHKSVSKALETASGILLGGELFVDLGTGSDLQVQSEQEYVTSKAKSLYDTKVGENKETNMAAERANVRLTAEYQALYS
jgi:hypothetical protein